MTKEELIKKVADFVEMEHRSCSMDLISAEYAAKCLQISIEDAEMALKAIGNK